MPATFDLEVESEPAGAMLGSIDFPRPSTTLYGSRLEVWGWAMGGDAPASAIEAGADGHEPARVTPGLPRPDVAVAFPGVPHAGRSGFSLLVDVPASDRAEITVSIALPGGRRARVGAIRLTARESEGWPAAGSPLVSVVIPCYNQAGFLAEAVESVRRQTYPNLELIVVDDGSTDDTGAVAAGLGVRCVGQENRGLAGARNRGLAESTGDYVVFLDADDRLAAHGVEANADAFKARPEADLVCGWFRHITLAGEPVPWPVIPPAAPDEDPYAALLSGRYWIACPAQVMYRRSALLDAGGFDPSFPGTEDLDLYLRMARERSVHAHELGPVCEYRQHPGAMSRDPRLMLASGVAAVRAQRAWTRHDVSLRAAYRAGLASMRDYFGEPAAHDLATALRRRNARGTIGGAWTLLRHYPRGLRSALSYLRDPSRLALDRPSLPPRRSTDRSDRPSGAG